MKEFRYLTYHTEYSCSGTFNLKMGARPCFMSAFNKVRNNSNIKYKIRLYPGIDLCKKASHSNACLFSKQEIRNHLLQLKDLFPFSYRVLDEMKGGNKIIVIHLHLKDVPATFHKYILTWIRYLYEYPYNVILKDAYLLREDLGLRFQSMSFLFNIVSSCQRVYVGEGHSIREKHLHTPLTKSELKKRIEEVRCLDDIYEDMNMNRGRLPETIGKFSYDDIEYWSEELFNEVRKPVYVELYNKVKGR